VEKISERKGECSIPVSRPHIYPRKSWQADPARTAAMKRHKVRRITLHHSGVIVSPQASPRQRIKTLKRWCMDKKGWPDIPYHFKIDFKGRIYRGRELRFAGDTNTSYKTAGHALVCLMGNYEQQDVNQKQLQAVVHLCAWLCQRYAIAPSRIKGHKDYAKTLCPGRKFYRYIRDGTIINQATVLLQENASSA
jgi:N-acetyl-anhydromuramyl-L-alanine amidase AmpD